MGYPERLPCRGLSPKSQTDDETAPLARPKLRTTGPAVRSVFESCWPLSSEGRTLAVVRKPKAEPWMSDGSVREEVEERARSRGGRDE